MKTIYPKYSGEFKCIAESCPDTCCAQWEIVIDEKYQKLYKEHPSAAAQKATMAMYTDADGDVCLRLNNGRCPMLNENNLCELYIDMGENALCDVCRIYPRFIKPVEDMEFCGISLSCPEAARLILRDQSQGDLIKVPVFLDEDCSFIWESYMKFSSLAKKGNFFACLSLAENIQNEIDFGDIEAAKKVLSSFTSAGSIPAAEEMLNLTKTISELEILTNEWRDLCNELILHLKKAVSNKDCGKKRETAFQAASETSELINIEIYYLYKYIAEAIEYADIVTTVKTAFICSAVICELYALEIIKKGNIDFDTRLKIAQLFSKEIEHNEDNIEKLMSE